MKIKEEILHFQLSILNSQIWGVSSAGSAPALQAGGHRFDPGTLHQRNNAECRIENAERGKRLTEVP